MVNRAPMRSRRIGGDFRGDAKTQRRAIHNGGAYAPMMSDRLRIAAAVLRTRTALELRQFREKSQNR
jgi:hypothetical protein